MGLSAARVAPADVQAFQAPICDARAAFICRERIHLPEQALYFALYAGAFTQIAVTPASRAVADDGATQGNLCNNERSERRAALAPWALPHGLRRPRRRIRNGLRRRRRVLDNTAGRRR